MLPSQTMPDHARMLQYRNLDHAVPWKFSTVRKGLPKSTGSLLAALRRQINMKQVVLVSDLGSRA